MTDPFSTSPSALTRFMHGVTLTADQQATLVGHFAGQELEQMMLLMSLSPMEREVFLASLRQQRDRTTVELADGSIGYYERGMRTDDCLAASLATCLQVPLGEVPDPRIDERLEAGEGAEDIRQSAALELERWLSARGLRIVTHEPPPWESPRWIGVVPFPGDFMNHTLVMTRRTILFDPVDRSRQSRAVRTYQTKDISHGFVFEPESGD